MSFETLDVVVLISGGIGITPMASVLHYLYQLNVKRRKENIQFPKLTSVEFHWSFRESHLFNAFQNLIDEVSTDPAFKFYFYQTAAPTSPLPTLSMLQSKDSRLLLDSKDMSESQLAESVGSLNADTELTTRGANPEFHESRPNFDEIFQSLRQRFETPLQKVNIGVLVCGTPEMTDDVSEACGRYSSSPNFYFQLHQETFFL